MLYRFWELPRWCSGKESVCQCRRSRRSGFNPWVGNVPWRRKWQPTPVFLPGESHGQRSLENHSPKGCKEPDETKHVPIKKKKKKRGPKVQDKEKDGMRGLCFLKWIQASWLPDTEKPHPRALARESEKDFLYWMRTRRLWAPSGSITMMFRVFFQGLTSF